MMDKNSHLILTQKENISLSDISFLQAQANYTILFLYSGKQIVATKTLKAIGLLLPSNEFIRPHRSFIIRQDFIETINFKNRTIVLKDRTNVMIARRRVVDLEVIWNKK